jgi:hypothetical protein
LCSLWTSLPRLLDSARFPALRFWSSWPLVACLYPYYLFRKTGHNYTGAFRFVVWLLAGFGDFAVTP